MEIPTSQSTDKILLSEIKKLRKHELYAWIIGIAFGAIVGANIATLFMYKYDKPKPIDYIWDISIYAEGANAALDAFSLLVLEQNLSHTNRPVGEMCDIVRTRLNLKSMQ